MNNTQSNVLKINPIMARAWPRELHDQVRAIAKGAATDTREGVLKARSQMSAAIKQFFPHYNKKQLDSAVSNYARHHAKRLMLFRRKTAKKPVDLVVKLKAPPVAAKTRVTLERGNQVRSFEVDNETGAIVLELVAQHALSFR